MDDETPGHTAAASAEALWAAVRDAYDAASPSLRAKITATVASDDQDLFKRWMQRLHMKGMSYDAAARRRSPYGTRLDNALRQDSDLAADVLKCHFGGDEDSGYLPNRSFLARMRELKINIADSSPNRVAATLQDLRQRFGGEEFELYVKVLEWQCPGWFMMGPGGGHPQPSPASPNSAPDNPAPRKQLPVSPVATARDVPLATFGTLRDELSQAILALDSLQPLVGNRFVEVPDRLDAAAAALRRAVGALRDFAARECSSIPCDAPPELRSACTRIVTDVPAGGVAVLVGACDELIGGTNVAASQLAEAVERLQALGDEVSVATPDTCRAVFGVLGATQARLADVRRKRRAENGLLVSALQATIGDVRDQFALDACSESALAEIERKLHDDDAVLSASGLEELDEEVGTVRAACERNPVAHRWERLLGQVRGDDRPAYSALLIARRLAAQGRPGVATLALWLAQQRYTAADVGTDADDLVVTTICEVMEALWSTLSHGYWSEVAGAHPWLMQLDLERVSVPDRLRLGLLLVGAASHSSAAKGAGLTLRATRLFTAGQPHLSRISAACFEGRPYALPDADPDEALTVAAAVVDAALADPFDKVRSAVPSYGRNLDRETLPIVRDAWNSLRIAAEPWAVSMQESLANARASASRACADHSFLGPEAAAIVTQLFRSMEQFAAAARARTSVPRDAVARSAIEREVNALAAGTVTANAAGIAISLLECGTGCVPVQLGDALAEICLTVPDVALTVPELVVRLNRAPSAELVAEDWSSLLDGLEQARPIEDAVAVLRDGSCLTQVCTLLRNDDGASEAEQAQHVVDDARRDLGNALDELGDAGRALRSDLARGRFAYVRERTGELRLERERARQSQTSRADAELRAARKRLRDILDAIDERDLEDAWKERTRVIGDELLGQVAHALSPQRTLDDKTATLELLEFAEPLVKLHVAHGSLNFHPLEDLRSRFRRREEPAEASVPADAQLRTRAFDGIQDGAEIAEERKMLWNRFLALRQFDPAVEAQRDAVRSLQRGIAKLVRAYSDEGDSQLRFQPKRIPGLPVASAVTAFHKPGASLFADPLMLHVLTGIKPARAHLDAIAREAEGTAAQHVVLAPGDDAPVKRALDAAIRSGRVTVAGPALMRRILEAPDKPWAPLRAALSHARGVDHATPFRSEGHVLRGQNLFVGREDLATQLQNGLSYVVWGGRRSGKTSLLHAVRAAFERRRGRYSVTYQSLESPASAKSDIAAAHRIAEGLGWTEKPSTLEAFRSQLEAACSTKPVVILLDEMDVYIARNPGLELIRTLRAVRNLHHERLICIFAGFKGLFRAVTLAPDENDSSYPWKNFVERCAPVGKLGLNDVQSLVQEGFRDLLGLEIQPTVPGLIFRYTGGHPAFVQKFCNRVLARIAQQARVTTVSITDAEVDAVFEKDDEFVQFVSETLEMNLGPLERIVVFCMAYEIGDGDPERVFTREDLADKLSLWFDGSDKSPTSSAIDHALLFLVMTGMLEKKETAAGEAYAMTFASYIDILRRLERARRDTIFRLIGEYSD